MVLKVETEEKVWRSWNCDGGTLLGGLGYGGGFRGV